MPASEVQQSVEQARFRILQGCWAPMPSLSSSSVHNQAGGRTVHENLSYITAASESPQPLRRPHRVCACSGKCACIHAGGQAGRVGGGRKKCKKVAEEHR